MKLPMSKKALFCLIFLTFDAQANSQGFLQQLKAFGAKCEALVSGGRSQSRTPEETAVDSIKKILLEQHYQSHIVSQETTQTKRRIVGMSKDSIKQSVDEISKYTGVSPENIYRVADNFPYTVEVDQKMVVTELRKNGVFNYHRSDLVLSAVTQILRLRLDEHVLKLMEAYLKKEKSIYYYPRIGWIDGKYVDYINDPQNLKLNSPLQAEAEKLFRNYLVEWFPEKKSYTMAYVTQFSLEISFRFHSYGPQYFSDNGKLLPAFKAIVESYTGSEVR